MEKINIEIDDKIKSEIIIKDDIRNKLENYFEDKNYFLITNKKIAKLYPHIIYKFHKDKVILLKDGEKYKNYKTYNEIMETLFSKKIERKDCIVALGGGVIGDLAGYVASTILRGVEFIQVPTTLLAMCDSSIGGKTGYNTKFGKNLIGTFYPASKVLIDPQFLNTLNDKEYKCGMGEVLKYAFIEKSTKCKENYNLIDFLTINQTEDVKREMKQIITMCASIKANVVNLDIKEGGLRKVLNFGHTFAHPIETLTNYKKIFHGKAVSLGMKYAAKLALNTSRIDKEYYDKIISLMNKFNLINKEIKFDKEKFINLMKQDKKIKDGKINLLLPVGPREVELVDNIEEPSIEACLP